MLKNICLKQNFLKNLIVLRNFSDQNVKKTSLYDLHLKHGGKMVNFANFSMPILYKDLTIIESHIHTRKNASIFDVSHMLQTIIKGKDRIEFIESLTVADVNNLKDNNSTLSLFTNTGGGIIDDLIITKTDQDYLYVVSNAGCIDKDKLILENKLKEFKSNSKDVEINYLDQTFSLIALQGPASQECLQKFVSYDLSKQYFMQTKTDKILDTDVRITRCGYTGEDGFEISIKNEKVNELVDKLLNINKVKLAGLGARDSLRIEAGLCLYGNDINEQTTPIEASLLWTINKSKRDLNNATYPGSDKIINQINKKIPIETKRIGLKALNSGPPARKDNLIKVDGQIIGKVTSGCPSPILKENIAIGYLKNDLAKIGNKVKCEIRNKEYDYEIVKMPFVPTKYYNLPKK